jgi:hypothetical protein
MPSLRWRGRDYGRRARSHTRRALVIVATVGLGVTLTATGAGALTTTPAPPVPLDALVVTQPLPDFTAAPAGTTNGPLTVSEFASQSSDPAQAEQRFNALAAKPGFGAFIRLWTDRGGPGAGANDLAILLFRIGDDATAQAFATGLNQPFEGAPGSTPFAVPSVPGARGYSVVVKAPVPAVEQVVVFRAGRYVSMVELASTIASTNPAPLTPAQAVAVSYSQLGQLRAGDPVNTAAVTVTSPRRSAVPSATTAPSPSGASTTPLVEALVAAVIVCSLVVVLVLLRRRRAGAAPEPALAAAGASTDPWAPGGVFAEFAGEGALSEDPTLAEESAPAEPSLAEPSPEEPPPTAGPMPSAPAPAPFSPPLPLRPPMAVPALEPSDVGSSVG